MDLWPVTFDICVTWSTSTGLLSYSIEDSWFSVVDKKIACLVQEWSIISIRFCFCFPAGLPGQSPLLVWPIRHHILQADWLALYTISHFFLDCIFHHIAIFSENKGCKWHIKVKKRRKKELHYYVFHMSFGGTRRLIDHIHLHAVSSLLTTEKHWSVQNGVNPKSISGSIWLGANICPFFNVLLE